MRTEASVAAKNAQTTLNEQVVRTLVSTSNQSSTPAQWHTQNKGKEASCATKETEPAKETLRTKATKPLLQPKRLNQQKRLSPKTLDPTAVHNSYILQVHCTSSMSSIVPPIFLKKNSSLPSRQEQITLFWQQNRLEYKPCVHPARVFAHPQGLPLFSPPRVPYANNPLLTAKETAI